MSARNAVVLLSGGLDSTTVLAIAQAEGFTASALSFDYGQRHATELDAARAHRRRGACRACRGEDRSARLRRLGADGGHRGAEGSLARPRWAAGSRSPTCRRATRSSSRSRSRGPRRSARATSSSASTPSTTAAIRTAGRSTSRPSSRWPTSPPRPASRARRGCTIHAPLIELTKEGIIRRGLELGVDYAAHPVCYDPDGEGRACGACDACPLRLRVSPRSGVPDPAPYAADAEVAS